jgi:MFS-type transporter involved in bile tolerance (Atg22 family)
MLHFRQCRRTKHALDGWDSAAFSGIFLARTESCSRSFIHARPPASNANRWATRLAQQGIFS